jgi:hypothetical protein
MKTLAEPIVIDETEPNGPVPKSLEGRTFRRLRPAPLSAYGKTYAIGGQRGSPPSR